MIAVGASLSGGKHWDRAPRDGPDTGLELGINLDLLLSPGGASLAARIVVDGMCGGAGGNVGFCRGDDVFSARRVALIVFATPDEIFCFLTTTESSDG